MTRRINSKSAYHLFLSCFSFKMKKTSYNDTICLCIFYLLLPLSPVASFITGLFVFLPKKSKVSKTTTEFLALTRRRRPLKEVCVEVCRRGHKTATQFKSKFVHFVTLFNIRDLFRAFHFACRTKYFF